MGIGVFSLILIVFATLVGVRLTITAARQTGRLKRYHPLVRWTCGVAGLLLFVAVGLGTMLHLRDVYRAEASTATVLIPAKPGVKPPAPNNEKNETPFEGRFLLQSILLSNDDQILHAETHDLTWPEASGKTIRTDLNMYGRKAIVENTLNKMNWRLNNETKNFSAIVLCNSSCSFSGYGVRYGSSGSYECNEDGAAHQIMHRISYFGKPFSLNLIAVGDIRVFTTIVPIQKDDPLAAQSAHLFYSEHMKRRQKRPLEPPHVMVSGADEFPDQATMPPLISLISHTTPAIFVLLIGAILVAQFFRKKSVALAVAMFFAMLYIAAIDRIVLDRHLGVLSDAGQSEQMRAFACWNSTSTFFHRARSEETYHRLMRDKATTPELRQTIQRAAKI